MELPSFFCETPMTPLPPYAGYSRPNYPMPAYYASGVSSVPPLAAPAPPPIGYVPPYPIAPPANREREVVGGTALYAAGAGGVGALIGLCMAGPVGAAWGAGIGSLVAQGFMQMLVRTADGSPSDAPRTALFTGGAALGLAAIAGGLGGVAAFAWAAVLIPAALGGLLLLSGK
jgi:hypothetical protein